MASILSAERDGMGFFYGHIPGDSRQINVRAEEAFSPIALGASVRVPAWAYYVGGERYGYELSKGEAERAAIKWAKDNPEGKND